MHKSRVALFVMLWCFSVLLAFGLGVGLTLQMQPAQAPQEASTAPPKAKPAVVPAPEKAASAEVDTAAADPAPSAGENDRLRVAFRQALRQVVDKQQPHGTTEPPAPAYIQSLWDRAFARWQTQKEAGMFGGMDESMNLMADMSRTGAPGMNFLASLVGNGQRPMEERELALAVLSHIQDGAALGAILKLNAPDVTELDYPYDLIETQVASLPTARDTAVHSPDHRAGERRFGRPGPGSRAGLRAGHSCLLCTTTGTRRGCCMTGAY